MTDADEAERLQPATLRLFFALWPDDATRDALYRTSKWLHQHLGGRRMRADTLHITLAFLGETPAGRLDAAVACAESVNAPGYALVLDRAGYWRHNRIGWLGASETPAEHYGLVTALNGALASEGFPVDARPHVPHVTLLRKAPGGEPPACIPVAWKIGDFVLVKSATASDGAHYEILRRWPLASPCEGNRDVSSAPGN